MLGTGKQLLVSTLSRSTLVSDLKKQKRFEHPETSMPRATCTSNDLDHLAPMPCTDARSTQHDAPQQSVRANTGGCTLMRVRG